LHAGSENRNCLERLYSIMHLPYKSNATIP
jgi:hypothetical protein